MKNKFDPTDMSNAGNGHPAFGSKGRRAYTEWFLKAYDEEPWKSRLINDLGENYYNEVMRIHRIRMELDNFNFGPQSATEWDKFREALKQGLTTPETVEDWDKFLKS